MGGFFLTPMTRFYAEMLQGLNSTNASAGAGFIGMEDFLQAVQDKLAQNGQAENGVSQTGRNEQAVQAMTMDQYKLYIYQKITGLPTSSTQKWDAVSVQISEEYRSESYPMGFRNGGKHTGSSKKKKEKSFWEKRAERHKLYMDLAQKAWYKRENERKYQEKIDFGRKEVSSAILKQQAIERATGERVELDANTSVLSKAATDFAQEYVFFKIPSALMNPKPKFLK